MMFGRLAYTILLWIFFPYAIWRIGQRHQWKNILWREYLGFVPNCEKTMPSQIVVWVHMVSVGEVKAATELLKHLNQQQDVKLCLSCTTLAARQQLQKALPDVWISALPLDYPYAVRQFFRRCQPDVGIILEAEFWPNLIIEAKKREVVLVLANARLSHRSAYRFRLISRLFSECIQSFNLILAQTNRDAGRLRCYRGLPVACVGNLKFDVKVDAIDDVSRLSTRPTLLLASTREGEEALLFDAMDANFLEQYFVIVALRHPHRAQKVSHYLQQRTIKSAMRSQQQAVKATTQVYIADTIGEMNRWYAIADVVIIGGSFIDYGGQNPIEPLQAQVPSIIGPYVRNYKRLVVRAVAQKALLQCPSATSAIDGVNLLMNNANRQLAIQAGTKFCKNHQGSLQSHIEFIDTILDTKRKETV